MIRPYASDDFEHVKRIWRETGWLDPSNPIHSKGLESLLLDTDTWVAEVDDAAECLGIGVDGTICHHTTSLPLCCVSAITTSHVGRRQGWASRITARLVAEAANRGQLVAALGMFDQGFYDKVGFGTGSYTNRVIFNPTNIRLPIPYRRPERLSVNDWEAMHNAYALRPARNGQCFIPNPAHFGGTLAFRHKGFGLGYRDPHTREVTHFVWIVPQDDTDHYRVKYLSYRSLHDFGELLGILKSLADQILSIQMEEPAGVQMQDLIALPFASYFRTAGSDYQESISTHAVWQLRVVQVVDFIAAIHLESDPVSFCFEIEDPIEKYLAEGASWKGTGGLYEITFGPVCHARKVDHSDLPVVKTTINAFSRLVFGVLSASSLAFSDHFVASADTLAALDRVFAYLPKPHPDWPL